MKRVLSSDHESCREEHLYCRSDREFLGKVTELLTEYFLVIMIAVGKSLSIATVTDSFSGRSLSYEPSTF
jgi:hypothetical protein